MAGPLDWLQQILGGEAGERSGPDVLSRLRRYLATSGEALSEAPAGVAKGVGDVGQMMYGLAQRQGMAEAGLPPAPESELAPLGAGARTLSGLTDFLTGGYATGAVPRGAPFAAREATAIPSLLADETGAIKAYHGSPYDFDRFDMSKIGTGEGAQAYGHGLYFAENPGTAQIYRDQVKNMPLIDTINERLSALSKEMDVLSPNGYRQFTGPEAGRGRELAAEYDRLMEEKLKPGHMYEAQINAEPEQFLQYERRLSEQSPQVQEALRTIPWGEPYLKSTFTGGEIKPMSAVGARELSEAGIPGIRYLDQGSRGAGEGTHNYVMFDDKLIEILRKYGIVPPLAAGGGLLGEGGNQ